MSHEPMNKFRSLCLASTAIQTPEGAALASSTDTSRHHDKVPVLTQACRMSNVLSALFYPGRLIRNLFKSRRYRTQLSLSVVVNHDKGTGRLAQSAFCPAISLAHLYRFSLSIQQLNRK